ncbi:MAG: hypothetical protein ACE5J0_03205 [Candidatus Paceibacterales bacterium]
MPTCEICGKDKKVHKNRKTGQLVCRNCYNRKFYKPLKEECSICGRVRPVVKRNNGKAVCKTCYHREFYKLPEEKCSICGQKRPVVLRTKDGQPVCKTCYYNYFVAKEECSICGRVKPVYIRDGSCPVCKVCYNREYNRLRKKYSKPIQKLC